MSKQLGLFQKKKRKRTRGVRLGRPKINLHDTNHEARPELKRCPAHITLRMQSDVPVLRTKKRFRAVQACLYYAQEKFGMRVIHYSVQGNHLHLLVESDTNKDLERGMKSFTIRFAKIINRALKRKGPAFAGRFHLRILKTPMEVR